MKLGNFQFWDDWSTRFWVTAVLWNLYTTLAHASSELFPPQVPSAHWPNQPTSGPYITSGGEKWWYFPTQGGGGDLLIFPSSGNLHLAALRSASSLEREMLPHPSPEDTQGPDKESLLAALLAIFLIFHSSVIKWKLCSLF